MSYGGYVMAAYAVFLVVLGWDWLAPRLELRRLQRNTARHAASQAGPTSVEHRRDPPEASP